jgi:hypothetical protein
MAHFRLDPGDDHAAKGAGHECDQDRTGDVVSEGRGEGPADEHAFDGDVDRACSFSNQFTGCGEQEQSRRERGTDIGGLAGEDLPEGIDESSHVTSSPCSAHGLGVALSRT